MADNNNNNSLPDEEPGPGPGPGPGPEPVPGPGPGPEPGPEPGPDPNHLAHLLLPRILLGLQEPNLPPPIHPNIPPPIHHHLAGGGGGGGGGFGTVSDILDLIPMTKRLVPQLMIGLKEAKLYRDIGALRDCENLSKDKTMSKQRKKQLKRMTDYLYDSIDDTLTYDLEPVRKRRRMAEQGEAGEGGVGQTD